jgi:hypothetical protein
MADVGHHASDDHLGPGFSYSFSMRCPGRPVTPGWVSGRRQEALRFPCVVS